jgi:hypothetical protein
MHKKCPVCDSFDGVREYIYGEPKEEPDASKYVIGGCCIYVEMPDYRCVNCSIDFFIDNDEFKNRIVLDDSQLSLRTWYS